MSRSIVVVVLAWIAGLTLGSDAMAKYVAPTRSVDQVAFAIGRTRPGSSKALRRSWAKTLIRIAKKHNFDPLSGWAIIAHESHWHPSRVGSDGQDIGLAQIRYTASSVCNDRESDRCEAYRKSLFDPAVNMARMAYAITAWRKLCKQKIGKGPLMSQWLQGYGGYSRPPNRLCGHKRVKKGKGKRARWVWRPTPVPKPVRDILRMRKRMIAKLRKKRIR